jgi:hypothetical protein
MTISHERCSSFGTPSKEVLLLRENVVELDTLTRIEVICESKLSREFQRNVVYVHWSEYGNAFGFTVLLEEETEILLIGAGTLSASINLRKMKLIHENMITLFWGFRKVRNWILELGELECFLYDREGNQLSSAPVDPPYEYEILDNGIKFESIVMGIQWLHFPQ